MLFLEENNTKNMYLNILLPWSCDHNPATYSQLANQCIQYKTAKRNQRKYKNSEQFTHKIKNIKIQINYVHAKFQRYKVLEAEHRTKIELMYLIINLH